MLLGKAQPSVLYTSFVNRPKHLDPAQSYTSDEAEFTYQIYEPLFQYHYLISAFTALENVMMPMLGAAGFPSREMQERAEALLESVGLTPWKNNMAGNMSGGQQQRVALARALAMNPALLLADEPTGNLDTKSADAVFALLRRINQEQGTTVLLVTHNPELGARCDKTIQVVDGLVQT